MFWFNLVIGAVLGACIGMVLTGALASIRIKEAWGQGYKRGQEDAILERRAEELTQTAGGRKLP